MTCIIIIYIPSLSQSDFQNTDVMPKMKCDYFIVNVHISSLNLAETCQRWLSSSCTLATISDVNRFWIGWVPGTRSLNFDESQENFVSPKRYNILLNLFI